MRASSMACSRVSTVPTGSRERLLRRVSTSLAAMVMGADMSGLESSTTMAVISLEMEAMGMMEEAFFW